MAEGTTLQIDLGALEATLRRPEPDDPTPEDVRMLLDGLEVGSIQELHELVELGRSERP